MSDRGEGSSTMSSSPVVPGTAKQLRVKRRIVNLVNPADALDFSDSSLSFSTAEDIPRPAAREVTPSPKSAIPQHMQTFTPLGMSKDGVKGILRPSGTPGSGNGVRFFPKNKFRVITPNQSINPAPSSPVPPAPTSFLSSLLAVTAATMSPRRPTVVQIPDISVEPEESWEQPGQEGEVSLVASSFASERSQEYQTDEEEEEAEPWAGTPQIHSSPLGLPTSLPDISTDAADQGELPSRDIVLPADMSDLMGQGFNEASGLNSFSVYESSRTTSRPASQQFTLSPIAGSPREETSSRSRLMEEDSVVSDRSTHLSLNDSNPTIRLPLAPLPSRASLAPQTPTPATKAFSSIFADMSAEQAELTWPLTNQASPLRSEVDTDETAFHSALFSNVQVGGPSSFTTEDEDDVTGNNRTTPGNATQYFDCVSPNSPAESSLTISSGSLLPLTPSPVSLQGGLIHPAKALFTAHSAHTTALASELDLYRQLVATLQAEVSERDGLLVELNLKAIEGEVWRTRADELEKRVKKNRSEEGTASLARRNSLSPSPRASTMRLDHPGDRTTAGEAAQRDLEIRLNKALADQKSLTRRLHEVEQERDQRREEVDEARASIQRLEEEDREAAIQSRRDGDVLRTELEAVTKRERSLHAQLQEAKHDLEEARLESRRMEGLETQSQAQEKRLSDRALKEAEELRTQLEVVNARETALQAQLEDFNTNSENDQRRIRDLESKMQAQERLIAKMKAAKEENDSEMGRLVSQLDEALDRVDSQRDMQQQLDEAEHLSQEENKAREVVERQIKAERRERADLEIEISELRRTLEETQADLLQRLNTPSGVPDTEVARLRSESASKDLEIITLQRRKNELKEDLEMLNIALDSKQQELELMKRKFAVKGIAGSTPLASSTKVNTASLATPLGNIETPLPGRVGMTSRRRSSAAFVTPSMGSMRGTGKVLKGGHGTDLWKTTTAQRVISKVEEENRPPVEKMGSVRGSMRRERILA